MSLIARTLLLLALLGGAFAQARAGVVDAPGAQLEVALITYGPGET